MSLLISFNVSCACAEEELRALQVERLYRAKAEISDSGKGYYEVFYEEGIFKAYGIIKK